ncbi:MAG: NAD-dependent epimerase/dehydratase family protein [Elusimicrobiota bacterium]|nr:NAD-dependent epimerase/dehydratase family protein [Elusimicrobiota bacterium]
MKALVTGATGFLGSHLVEELLKQNFSVKCPVRNPKKLKWLEGLPVEIVCGDCSDKKSLELAVENTDYVFHSAGLVRAIKSDELYTTNVVGTKNLVEAVFKKNPNIKRFVYISSQAASGPSEGSCIPRRVTPDFSRVGVSPDKKIGVNSANRKTEDEMANPVSHYGFSKLLGELEVLKFKEKLPVTILRPPSIYGPRDNDVFVFFDYAKKGFLPIPSDEKFINISYVSDIVDGIISSALKDTAKGQTYFIGDDKVFSWKDLCEVLKKTVNPKARIIKTPYFIFWTSAFFSEIIARIKNKPALVSFDKLNEMKQKSWLFSSAKSKSDLGYATKISLEEGIKITYNWYKNNNWL